jgi:serine/threonine protein kinase
VQHYPDSDRLPMDFGEFRLTGVLGKGGMGTVFLGHKRSAAADGVSIEVAVKVINRSLLEEDPLLASSVLDEARLVSNVKHPNVVALLDVGEVHGVPYMVMERLRGEPLSRRLKRGPLSRGQLLYVGLRVLKALAPMHAAGLVHRDLKPSNIFLTDHHEVKLLDFGIAKPTHGDARDLKTGTGLTKGTPGYLSPEQSMARTVDGRTDLFALGLILAECATGDVVYNGGSVGEIYAQLFKGNAFLLSEDVQQRVERVVPGLGDLVMRLLEQEASDRPSSAAEVEAQMLSLAGPIPQVDLSTSALSTMATPAEKQAPTYQATEPSIPAVPAVTSAEVSATEVIDPAAVGHDAHRAAPAPAAVSKPHAPKAPIKPRSQATVEPRSKRRGGLMAAGAAVVLLGVFGVGALLLLAVGAGVATQLGVFDGSTVLETPANVDAAIVAGLDDDTEGAAVIQIDDDTEGAAVIQPDNNAEVDLSVGGEQPTTSGESPAQAAPTLIQDARPVAADALGSAVRTGLAQIATAKTCKVHGPTQITVWVRPGHVEVEGTDRGVGCYRRAVAKLSDLPNGRATLTVGPF